MLSKLIESNLMENIQAITGFDLVVTMILSLAMGLFILVIYSRIYQGAMYSASFAVSLTALTMISTALILAITSNLVLSLGMVGALSIVRFRTAIKDPLEIVFLFWSIETGIVLATGILTLGVVVNIGIGCVLLVLVIRKPEAPYILVLRCEKQALKKVDEELKKSVYYTVKSRKVEPRSVPGGEERSDTQVLQVRDTDIIELDIEITLNRNFERKHRDSGLDKTEFVDKLRDISGVSKALLVTYNGAYMS